MSLYNLLDKIIEKTKQSDYFVNDPTHPSFIKNRPFESWVIPKNTILWGGKEIMYSVDKELPEDRPLGLVPGAKYKIEIGEPDVTPTSYECVAEEYISSTGQRYVLLGNIELYHSTNVREGLPFILYETFYEHSYASDGSFSGEPKYYNHCNLFKDIVTKDRYSGNVYIKLESMEEVEWVRPLHTKYYTSGGGNNTGGVSSWNDLTDKPFESNMVEIFNEEPTFTFLDSAEVPTYFLSNPLPLDPNTTYTVLWDNETYLCTPVIMEEEEPDGTKSTAILLGNYGVMMGEEDTGEPFLYMNLADETITFIDLTMVGGTHSISIFTGNIKKLDNKFLDLDWLPTIEDTFIEIIPETTINISGSGNFTIDNAVAFKNGGNYMIRFDGEDYYCRNKLIMIDVGVLGNEALMSDSNTNTEEPFLLLARFEPTTTFTIYTSTAGEHTIRVFEEAKEYNTMPKEFLPEGVVIDEVADFTVTTDLNTRLGGTNCVSIREALKNGKKVYATLDGIDGEIISFNYTDTFDNHYSLCFVGLEMYKGVVALVETTTRNSAPAIRGLYPDGIILNTNDTDGFPTTDRYKIAINDSGETPTIAVTKL